MINNDTPTPTPSTFANALAFIVESMNDDPERSLSFIAQIDPISLDEFATDNNFTDDEFDAAIAMLRKVRAQIEY